MLSVIDLDALLDPSRRRHRELARQLLDRWKELEPSRPSFPQSPALGAKIGLLRKGDVTWWRNHPGALRALAQILGCSPHDLVAERDVAPDEVPIRSFPALAPLLPGQTGCALRDDGAWLGSVVEGLLLGEPRAWVQAPRGAGKSLSVEVLRQRYGARIAAVSARTLTEAFERELAAVPLVVELSEPDAATDASSVRRLERHGANVCVLAAFPRPRQESARGARWRDVAWSTDPGWRERLVKWAQLRAPVPQEVDASEWLGWFDTIDPHERLFATPLDVLQVLAIASRTGGGDELAESKKPLLDLAKLVLADAVASTRSPWMRELGRALVFSLIRGRFDIPDGPFSSLAVEDWIRLVPADFAVPQKSASAPVKARDGRKKPTGASGSESLEAIPPGVAVRLLVDAELLSAQADGSFDFPAWMRAGVERECIEQGLQTRSTEWARWALDPVRRAALDDALDATSPTRLFSLAERALAGVSPELHTVAAIEALFSAFGRRVRTGWAAKPEAVATLHRLAERQLELIELAPLERRFPLAAPLTRHDPACAATKLEAWTLEAWRLSFAVPPPQTLTRAGWALPGWAPQLSLASAPRGLPGPSAGRELLGLAVRAVERCTDRKLPEDVPPLLLVAAAMLAPSKGWTLSERHWRALLWNPENAEALGRMLGGCPGEAHPLWASPEGVDPREVVRSLWKAEIDALSQLAPAVLRRLQSSCPSLFDALAQHLPDEDLAHAIATLEPSALDEGVWLQALPPRLMRAGLVALLARFEVLGLPAFGLGSLLARVGEEDLDLLLRFARGGHDQGYAAARQVWSIAPEVALKSAREGLSHADRLSLVWLHTAPRSECPGLLQALRASPVPWPPGTKAWLADLLPGAGAHAAEVYALLRGHSEGNR